MHAPDIDEHPAPVNHSIEQSGPLCVLPIKVWLVLIVGAVLLGVTQGFTMMLSGFVQRQFGYTNQEGGFMIVSLLSQL